MVIGDAKNSVKESHLFSENYVKDKRSSLTTKPSQPQKSTDNCVYEENFIFEYAERDDELKDWLHTNLPVAEILAGFRGDADLVIINGDSPRPYQIIQKALNRLDLKARFTIGIAGTVIIQMTGGGHSAVTGLGEKMRDAAINDLVHHSNEETQLERDDIVDCIETEGDDDIRLSANVYQVKKVVETKFDRKFPKWLTKMLHDKMVEDEEEESFTKSPDFSFRPLYRFMWTQFKKRKLVSSAFGEVSSSDSTGKGAFDALQFVGGNKLQTDLSVNADLKFGRIKGQKRLNSMTVNLFDVTAGRLLDLSKRMDIDDEDRSVLRSAAKLKACEQLEALRLLERLISLPEISPVTLKQVWSDIFRGSDSDFPLEIFDDRTMWTAEICASIYGKLSRTVDNTIAYYEDIRIQVSDAENIEADEMEERILRLVATHSSAATVSVKEDGRLKVDAQEGISFPTLSFSGLLPNGGGRSELSAKALCAVFVHASRNMKNDLRKTVLSSELGFEDIDKEGYATCAKAMFPNVKNPKKRLKSLFDSKRKRSPAQVELQYLTKDALIRIGSKHHEGIPSDVSESLAIAYAVDSISRDKRQKEEREREVKRMRSSTSGTGEPGRVEQSDSVGSSGTSTELPEQGPTSVSEVLKNMPGTRDKRERVKELLSSKALQRSIEQDTIALQGFERLLQENIFHIEGIFSVPDNVLQFLHAKGSQQNISMNL